MALGVLRKALSDTEPRRPVCFGSCAFLIVLFFFQGAAQPPNREEQIARHRNLGKAFFENPTTQKQAVVECKKALDLAPESARERLNYAIALLAAGQTQEGIAELERVRKQDPRLPHTWFNLGIQYKKLGDYERAAAQFTEMVKLAPDEPISHYNLGTLHKLAGRNELAIREFETAARLDPNLAAPHFQLFNMYRQAGRREDSQRQLELFQQIKKQQEGAAVPEDMEWSYYSEIHDPVDQKAALADRTAPAPLRFVARKVASAGKTDAGQLVLLDYNADQRPDLLAVAGGRVRLFGSGTLPVNDPALARLAGVLHATAGDYNNDGFPDLCLLTATGPVLLTTVKGRFTKSSLAAPAAAYRTAVWLDYDHDYDLDLVLLGETATLLRNQGSAGFADRTADIPFAKAPALSAFAFRLIPDTKGIDLAVTYADRPAMLYRDRLGGKFEAEPLAAIPSGSRLLQVTDADNNGAIDLLYESGGKAVLALNDAGKFGIQDTDASSPAMLADLENRAIQDLVSRSGVISLWGRPQPPKSFALDARAIATADFNGDGKLDAAVITTDGSIVLHTNQTPTGNRWMRVALTGVKNGKLAYGSEVEVKSGVRYQKKIYEGIPLHFGLRGYAEADAVRITWPNGLIQSEAKQLTSRAQVYKEAQRLSGSCPQVFAWNGREFVYITDVLGVAPLGAAAGDGTYFPTDHLEHIQIPAAALQPREGKYEIRLTEELAEVAYIDRVRLIAVDHPKNTSVYSNEKFQSPPYPELEIYTVSRLIPPLARRDKPGAVEFDFPLSTDARLLILTGWVDWPDGSTFLAKSQQSDPFTPPALQLRGVDGQWRTIDEDIGLPAGKPKSIVIELPAVISPPSLRIATNTPVHWTEARLAERLPAQPRLTALAPVMADLRFRGFSRVRIDPERRQPERFFYDNPLPASMWNPTPGMYTRYGETRELLKAPDDRYIIMGSGDELALSFDAAALPAPPSGTTRSFLLAVDGWAKDRDSNTAHSQTVEPLPFRRMTAYPYGADERFPDTEAHRKWREYNTRPGLRTLRPLSSAR